MAFDVKYQDLGRRIVRAARIAAAIHAYESARAAHSPGDTAQHRAARTFRISGTGW